MSTFSTDMKITRLRELMAAGLDDVTIEIIARIERVNGTGADPRPYTLDLIDAHGESRVEAATAAAWRYLGRPEWIGQ